MLHTNSPKGKSDPYCIVSGGEEKKKTKTIPRNLNPEWNECLEMLVFFDSYIGVHSDHYSSDLNRAFQQIEITVLDEDLIGAHDFMGRVLLNTADFADGKVVQKWYPLKPRTPKVQRPSENIPHPLPPPFPSTCNPHTNSKFYYYIYIRMT